MKFNKINKSTKSYAEAHFFFLLSLSICYFTHGCVSVRCVLVKQNVQNKKQNKNIQLFLVVNKLRQLLAIIKHIQKERF